MKLINDERIDVLDIEWTGRHALVDHVRFGYGVRAIYSGTIEWPEGYDDDAPYAGTTDHCTGFLRDGRFVPIS